MFFELYDEAWEYMILLLESGEYNISPPSQVPGGWFLNIEETEQWQ